MTDSSQPPAREPPAGVTSNLTNPNSNGSWQTVTNIICTVFVVTFVVLRLYTRIRLVKNIYWDDYIIVIATCLFLVDIGLFQHMVTLGLGKHPWDVRRQDFSPGFLETWTFAAVVYSATLLCIKLSILMLYRRLFPISNFRIRWWATLCLTIGYAVGAIFASLFACIPLESNWNMNVIPDHCIDKKAFYVGNGVLNITTDLAILALPIPIVWSLSLQLKQKIILSIMFTLGSISCVISIVRLQSIVTWIRVGDDDITHTLQAIVVWSTIELAICIVCANTPTLRPFFERHLGFITSIISSGNGTTPTAPSQRTTGRPRKRSRGLSLRYDNANNMEMAVRNKTTISVVANGVDSDDASTRGLYRNESFRDLGGDDKGIMVRTSAQVKTASEAV